MTQDDVIHMAHVAGLTHYVEQHTLFDARIIKFAQLVAAKEREACAKLCEEQYEYYGFDHVFAAKIRARSNHG